MKNDSEVKSMLKEWCLSKQYFGVLVALLLIPIFCCYTVEGSSVNVIDHKNVEQYSAPKEVVDFKCREVNPKEIEIPFSTVNTTFNKKIQIPITFEKKHVGNGVAEESNDIWGKVFSVAILILFTGGIGAVFICEMKKMSKR